MNNDDNTKAVNDMRENLDKNIEEIENEISECREDERNAQNQIVQVIGTGGTMMGVIFGAATFLTGYGDTSYTIMEDRQRHALFYLNSIVLIVTMFYVISLGINNVLRYHYIRDLEDKLYILISKNSTEKGVTHWMSFSSPVTTRNPTHLKSGYSILHYLSYAIATLCAAAFCVVVTLFEYNSIEMRTSFDLIILIILGIIMLVILIVFIAISVKVKICLFMQREYLLKKEKRDYQNRKIFLLMTERVIKC
ncbi:MAG: hypothetical protein ACLTC0_07050 [Eisenbergiella massiliensis]|uniref:hypothetical protein n=1 Tax=Eisenbergiella massiliensis TaxID=1720294 RepID=UPI0039928BB5